MEARECRILTDCLSIPGPQFVVPVYQRNYTWDSKNVLKLMEDIYSLMIQVKREHKKDAYHFIGSIVNLRRGDGSFYEREIIDGQQRLTTIFLILYALRDIAIKQENKDVENSLRNYLENIAATGQNEKYHNKLKPNLTDDGVLQKIIDQRIALLKNSKSAIYSNYKTIISELNGWIAEGYTVADIIDAIDHIMIVWVSISDVKSAQQTFESINSTGEPLKASDLIRNYVLMNFSDEEQTKYYKKYWLAIENNIVPNQEQVNRKQVSKKVEEFFRFFLSLKKRKMIPISTVYEEFKVYWEQEIENEQTKESILEEIALFSQYFFNLYWKELNEFPDYMQKSLELLRQTGSTMIVPMVLGIWDLYYNQLIDEYALDRGIRLVCIYLIRRAMADKDTSPITNIFSPIFNKVKDNCEKRGYDQFIEVLKYYLSNANENNSMAMPNDDAIMLAMKTNNSYVLAVTKIFFSIIESEQNWNGIEQVREDNEKNPIMVDLTHLTIEHIMPQEPTQFWIDRIGDMSPNQYSQLVNTIGNLTLADRKTNSKMNNRDFDYKKKAIEDVGRLNINREIINAKEWNNLMIKERTEKLAKMFNIKFPYFSSCLQLDGAKQYEIYLNIDDIKATASIYMSGKTVVHMGSVIKENARAMLQVKNRRIEMMNRGDLSYDSNTKLFTVRKDISFLSLTEATKFIYGGCNDGWLLWTTKDGECLNDTIRYKIEKLMKD